MNIINPKISKRLTDLGLLDNIETRYIYRQNSKLVLYNNNPIITHGNFYNTDISYTDYKTLTLEEAIYFLKENIDSKNGYQDLWNAYLETGYNGGSNIDICFEFCNLNKIEKMIEYLLDNNLFTN